MRDASEVIAACPFCGSTDTRLVGKQRPYWYRMCNGCGASNGLCHTQQQAHDDWNRRTLPAATPPAGDRVGWLLRSGTSTYYTTNEKIASAWEGGEVQPLYTTPQPASADVVDAQCIADRMFSYLAFRSWDRANLKAAYDAALKEKPNG